MCRPLPPVALVWLLGLVLAGGVAADPLGSSKESPGLSDSLEALVRATGDYRTALARVLALREAEQARAGADVPRQQALAERGIVARRAVEVARERASASAALVEATRLELARVDVLVAEARAAVILARTPPPGPGERREAHDHVAFGGGRAWSLAQVPVVERFFAERFGRDLPVSAYGQTALHDRLGFDHRRAVDVALHPDTAEGRDLIAYLESEHIPFIAFRGAQAGASTGAHVHIGEPSPRKPIAGAGPRRSEP